VFVRQIGPSLGLPASDAEAWGIARQNDINNSGSTSDGAAAEMASTTTTTTTSEREPKGDYHQRYLKELTLCDNSFSGQIPPGLLGPPLQPLPKPPPTPPHQQQRQREGDRLRLALERFKNRHHHHHHQHKGHDSGDEASMGSGGSFDSASASIDESHADHSTAGEAASLALQEEQPPLQMESKVVVQPLDQELTVPRGLTPDQENAFRQTALFEGTSLRGRGCCSGDRVARSHISLLSAPDCKNMMF